MKRIYRNRKHGKLYKKYLHLHCFDDWPRWRKDKRLSKLLRKRLNKKDKKEIKEYEKSFN